MKNYEEGNKRKQQVMTVLTPQIVQRLDVVAQKRTSSRSLLIRQACEQFLKQAERETESVA